MQFLFIEPSIHYIANSDLHYNKAHAAPESQLVLVSPVLHHVVDDLLRGSVRLLGAESHLAPPGAAPTAGLATPLGHHLAAGAEKVADILLGPLIIETREPDTVLHVTRTVTQVMRECHLSQCRLYQVQYRHFSVISQNVAHFSLLLIPTDSATLLWSVI